MKKHLLILILSIIAYGLSAQNIIEPDVDSIRLARIEAKLAQLAEADNTYNEEVDISIGKMPLSDMLRNIAKVNRVNLSVKGVENTMITCNFSRAKIVELLFFLCKEYNLDLDVIGNIVSIKPVVAPAAKPKILDIYFVTTSNNLSYDLGGDKLIDVIKKITTLTGVNFVITPSLYSRQISGYASAMPFDEAIQTLISTNGLEVVKTPTGSWEIYANSDENASSGIRGGQGSSRRFGSAGNELLIDSMGLITAQIGRANVRDIIVDLCEQQGFNYFFVSPVDHQTSIFVREVKFETLLSVMMGGTQYSYYLENDIYIFGGSTRDSGLLSVRVIPLVSRSVSKIDDIIPESLKAGLQIKSFVDLNSIVASGDQKSVARVETFIKSIDKRVPLITIEVLIVDVTKKVIMEAGINMGLGGAPAKTSGTLSPGVNMNLNAGSVNNLINSFNGFGSINLGKVSSDFYMSLKFLEDNGVIEMRSTPKLSTLNGHEAVLKSGETQYYKETSNTFMGSQNPIHTEAFVWKNVEANLSLTITPFVSEDNHITLEIYIEQTEFTARAEKNGPPGTATRSFKSLIRVQNEEMVLLGGIDRHLKDKSSKGLPFIARVPILKWFFGSSKNNKEEHKLNVFIKPTLID